MTIKQIAAAIAALVILGAIYGAYQYPKAQVNFGSPAGTTFGTAKFAGVTIDLSSNSGATSTSILNTDASDRYITEVDATCNNTGSSFTAYTGAGLANLQLSVGTSSSASPAAVASVGQFSRVASAFNIGTTTAPVINVASSTTALSTSTKSIIWHSGEYLTFWWNATNTPATGFTSVPCTEGVKYNGS